MSATAGLEIEDLLRELLAREEAMESLASFIEYVSGQEVPRHMRLVCDKLDQVVNGEITRLMVSMPPGHGKSYIVSHYFPAYYLAKNPKRNVIFSTHKQELSDSFGLKVRNLIKSEEFLRIFPDIGVSSDKTAAGEWMTTAGGG